MLGRADPSQLPEAERLAYVAALSAVARADGAASLNETLAVLEEVDLEGLSDEGVHVLCDSVLDPPSLDAALEPLKPLPRRMLTEVVARLLWIARSDGELQAAESAAIRRAGELLDLTDGGMKRAHQRVERERWRRRHALDRAHGVDAVRNLLVAAAGLGAPVYAIFHLGLERAADPRVALLVGLDRLGGGFGLVAGIVAAMGISVAAAAVTSAVTLRGWRAARLRREGTTRVERVRGNLRALVDHASRRLAQIRYANGPRVAYKNLEGRLQTLQGALMRLRSE